MKMILYVEHTVDANDLPTALWRFCNNLDPKRDHLLYKRPDLTPNAKHQIPNSKLIYLVSSFQIPKHLPVSVLTEQGKRKNGMIFTATGPILLWQTKKQ